MILAYHAIVADREAVDTMLPGMALARADFLWQLGELRRRFILVSLERYLREVTADPTAADRLATLTFDDGLAVTWESLRPMLVDGLIPATMFVSTAPMDSDRLLWCYELDARCFDGDRAGIGAGGKTLGLRTPAERKRTRRVLERMAHATGDPAGFSEELAARFPVPTSCRSRYRGMTSRELREASDCGAVEIGAHTVHHPLLSRLKPADQTEEIARSRSTLEATIGRSVRYFAYPSNDYDARTVALVEAAGFAAAFALVPRRVTDRGHFEQERVGIYSGSRWKFRGKLWRLDRLARWAGLSVG